MVSGTLILTTLTVFIVAMVLWVSRRWGSNDDSVIDQIDALLPQTQCAQCGYPGCRPYANAIASGEADINQCPPGGQAGVDALADLLGLPSKPLNEKHGTPQAPMVALIDEDRCIGCTLCIQACPVDAILGAQKMMHTVLASECTGCELCLAPCPVDCIDLVPAHRPMIHPKPELIPIRVQS